MLEWLCLCMSVWRMMEEGLFAGQGAARNMAVSCLLPHSAIKHAWPLQDGLTLLNDQVRSL